MDVVRSRIDTGSESFHKNRQDMQALLAEVEGQLALARGGGGDRSVARHRERGKLLIRERIELLLDRDAPFLELSPLAGWGTDFSVGGGFVSGLGVVSGVECIVCGHDPTVLGGAITAVSLKKINRALEISRLNRLPYIQFVESAGGDLRRGTEDLEAEMRRQLTHFAESGRLFHDITCLSGERIPTVSIVFGSSTAGGAYQPGMTDYNVFIRNRLQELPRFPEPATADTTAGGYAAPMPGKVLDIRVRAGDTVAKGHLLLTMEAMKMERQLTASRDGVVTEVRVSPGQQVDTGQVLLVIEALT